MLVPILWIAAFVFSLPLVEPYALARLLAVTCALGAAGVTIWRGGVPRLSGPVTAALLFWVLAAVSVAFSAAPYISLMAFGTFSLMPLSALAFIAAPERALRTALAGAGVVLGGLALWAIAQHLFFTDMLVFGQVRHPFANPNNYAALLALGVLPALGAAMGAAGRLRTLLLLLAAILTVGVVIIGSRSVFVLLVLAAAVFFMMTRGAAGSRPFVVFAAALGTGLLFALTGDNPPIARLFEGVAHEAAGFGRGPLWQAAAAMTLDHPLTGTGLGTFGLYYPAYRLPGDVASGGFMAHSDPLQFAVEMGWAAAAMFYAFLGLCLLRMKKVWAGLRNKAWTAGLFCALGALMAHSHVDFDLYAGPVLCAAGLALGAWYRCVDGAVVMMRLPLRAGAVTVMLAAFFLLQGMFISEYQVGAARTLAMKGDMEGFGARVNTANKDGFGMNAQAYMLAATLPIGLMHGAALTERPALYAQAMELLAQAEARNEQLASVPFYRAQAAALFQPADAPPPEFWLRATLALNPQHTEARVLLAQRLRAAGYADEAYAVLKTGLAWPYGAAAAQDFYDELGAQALMRKDMETFSRMGAAAKQLEARRTLPAWMGAE